MTFEMITIVISLLRGCMIDSQVRKLEKSRDLLEKKGGRAYLKLAVGDTGEGIAPEAPGKIFEPFFYQTSRWDAAARAWAWPLSGEG